jgi:hypothetical protein
MATTDFGTVDFYPNSPQDAAETLLRDMVRRRELARQTIGVGIDDFSDFINTLEKDLAEEAHKKGRFIREIHVWGHGDPGRFKFGSEYLGADDLGKRGMGLNKHIAPFSTLYLRGCNAAAGKEGKEFLYQLGRVVFGCLPGYLWGNTRPVSSAMGVDQSPGDPVEYSYPNDFQDR